MKNMSDDDLVYGLQILRETTETFRAEAWHRMQERGKESIKGEEFTVRIHRASEDDLYDSNYLFIEKNERKRAHGSSNSSNNHN